MEKRMSPNRPEYVSGHRRLPGGRRRINRIKVTYDAIHRIVSRIPRGRVATYGQIAELAGIYGQARRVGYALSALPKNSPVPWQRVVNAEGKVSQRGHSGPERLQKKLLRSEGVLFDRNARIPMDRFQWRPSS
jgi:methylated-DNA-protein-cysteine methyltransferase-like protein